MTQSSYALVNKLETLIETMNSELKKLSLWFKINKKMSLNVEKKDFMLFGNKKCDNLLIDSNIVTSKQVNNFILYGKARGPWYPSCFYNIFILYGYKTYQSYNL